MKIKRKNLKRLISEISQGHINIISDREKYIKGESYEEDYQDIMTIIAAIKQILQDIKDEN